MLYDSLPIEVKIVTEEQLNSLQGDMPFNSLLESIAEQFQEFLDTGFVKMDKTNYIDSMANAVNISKQINTAAIDEFQNDDGVIVEMKEKFDVAVLELMKAINVDLYQVENPDSLAYILYTNFMLTDQRQDFFNYVVNYNVRHQGMESDLAIAHGMMLEDKPQKMYELVSNMFPRDLILNTKVEPFLKDCGFIDLYQWVEDGSLPIDILFDVFLRQVTSFDMMFVTYYQQEKELIEYED